MSNPHRRDQHERVDRPAEYRELDGSGIAKLYAELWSFAEDDDRSEGDGGSFLGIALRIRHGARVACRRLREERDEARGAIRFTSVALDKAVTQLGDARAALDVARRELRARRAIDRWLAGGPISRSLLRISGAKARVVDALTGEYRDAPSYPALATALGLAWEGDND